MLETFKSNQPQITDEFVEGSQASIEDLDQINFEIQLNKLNMQF